MANEQERQTTSELAEQHHCLDWYGVTRHFEGNRGQSTMEEDHPQCGQPSDRGRLKTQLQRN